MSVNDPNNDNDVSLSASLVHVATLTNHELFTKVVATLKQSAKQKKDGKKCPWQQHIAIKVATSAVKGEDEYCSANHWVKQYHSLSTTKQEDASDGAGSKFKEALKALPARECYRKRLQNALDGLSSSSDNTELSLSIKEVVGLIRCSTFVVENCDDNGNTTDNDCQLQVRAISHLVKSMPQLATTNPCDIFMAVQLPLLQKIHWDRFINGGIKFTSADNETEFRSLLNLKFDKPNNVQTGEKRKRSDDDSDEAFHNTVFGTMPYLLEAAHLARKGAVRAQHGAVIFIPSEDGDGIKTKVIGRGFNHDYLLDRSKCKKNKIVLHSEVHAVVDAIQKHGEEKCFNELFPRATIMIVELESDLSYDTCHPCPKCDPMLQAVGIPNVLHTTPYGKLKELDLSPANPSLLSNENVSIPLGAACDEREITCKRLEQAASSKIK